MLAKLLAVSFGALAVVGPSGGQPGGSDPSGLPVFGDNPMDIVTVCYRGRDTNVRRWRVGFMIALGAKRGPCQ